jgi:hypothetical protein
MNASQVPAWVQLLAALLTPTIALLGAYIAWQQWRTNRNKLKLELFDRRYRIYEAAQTLIGRVLALGKASHEQTFEFLSQVKGAKFMFNEKVQRYLEDDLYRKAERLLALSSDFESLDGTDERKANLEKQREVKDWFKEQYENLDTWFSPYLHLAH